MNRLDQSGRSEVRGEPGGLLVVSILSGKGGVGKSVIAFNLAERAAAAGCRTLLVDADIACGNLAILANVDPADGLERFSTEQCSLADAVVPLNEKLSLLAQSASGRIELLSSISQVAEFATNLRRQAESYDLVLIDHSSGISTAAAVLASASDLNLLVLVPELTSISDCYGLYKYLYQSNSSIDCRLLLNRTESKSEAEYVWSRFAALVEQFLGGAPQLAGVLPEDAVFRQAVAGQKPISAVAGESPVLQRLDDLIRGFVPTVAGAIATGQSMEINNLTAYADIRE